MEGIREPLSGYRWQPVGSEAPDWQDGYDRVYAWFLQHARGGSHWDGLIAGAHEAMKSFKGESSLQLDFSLKLNQGKSTIKIIHERAASPEFVGHEGRILLCEMGKKEVLAERPFFVVMEGEKAVTVALRSQIL